MFLRTPLVPHAPVLSVTKARFDSGRRPWERTCPRRRWFRRPIFGNALGDAPRHRSAPRHLSGAGRGASRTACPRGAWAR
ncbi:hypothetical protein BW686_02640 [Pseudomonas syringae]|uniref:DUF1534 domain-containing protein n=1 Tax=Pseudomonas syringae TaxID=317 RepID=A0A244EWH3_PSESX|nr:hypothetical protein BW686_02640 [Pseudomonas syringae]